MHPVEHLVYFSALLLPALLDLFQAEMVPFWVLSLLSVSLVIYPIPSHIGYAPFERHHWQHHTEFNYNYGSSQLFDVLFGTTFEAYQSRKASSSTGRITALDQSRQAEAKRQRELAMQ